MDPNGARIGAPNVAFVGFADHGREDVPWDDPAFEIWGLNEEYVNPWMKRWDRWFQLHTKENYSRPTNQADPNHFEWLKKQRGFPIYLHKLDPDIPAGVEYPMDEIVEKFGDPYFTSSFAYLVALALHLDKKVISVHGFLMASDTEWYYQKPGGEYWIGMARGRGVEVRILPGSPVCRGLMYGREAFPFISREFMANRISTLTVEEQNKIVVANRAKRDGAENLSELAAEVNLVIGARVEASRWYQETAENALNNGEGLGRSDIDWRLNDLSVQQHWRVGQLGQLMGRTFGLEEAIKKCNGQAPSELQEEVAKLRATIVPQAEADLNATIGAQRELEYWRSTIDMKDLPGLKTESGIMGPKHHGVRLSHVALGQEEPPMPEIERADR